jgi:hypothetical protein
VHEGDVASRVEDSLTSPQTLALAQHLPLLHVVPNAHCSTMAPHDQMAAPLHRRDLQKLLHERTWDEAHLCANRSPTAVLHCGRAVACLNAV